MKVIAISGKAGHGKDTVATMMKKELETWGYNVIIAHYADLLKYICRTFFDWNGEKDDYGRWLLQYVGTDTIRAERPDYWVDFMCDMLKWFGGEWDYVLIPDTRFPNEIDRLRQDGFDVIHARVMRPGYKSSLTAEQQAHPSETALDKCSFDWAVLNVGTMDSLSWTVHMLIKEELDEI